MSGGGYTQEVFCDNKKEAQKLAHFMVGKQWWFECQPVRPAGFRFIMARNVDLNDLPLWHVSLLPAAS